jgi:hypothetical protein
MKTKRTGNFKKVSTPEMVKKQRAAIISYYVKKRKEEPSKSIKSKEPTKKK